MIADVWVLALLWLAQTQTTKGKCFKEVKTLWLSSIPVRTLLQVTQRRKLCSLCYKLMLSHWTMKKGEYTFVLLFKTMYYSHSIHHIIGAIISSLFNVITWIKINDCKILINLGRTYESPLLSNTIKGTKHSNYLGFLFWITYNEYIKIQLKKVHKSIIILKLLLLKNTECSFQKKSIQRGQI